MMEIAVAVLTIVTSAITGFAVWYAQQKINFDKTERQALQLLMRDLFLNKYKDVKTREDYDYIEKVYKTYEALGGNGYVKLKYENLKRSDL